ncbi:MAG: hypothetical protein CMO80_04850 [Verrucomicrobiales bacterium]|nr:hypothetical protein [Verrucomicrobiales bacterium]
MSEHGIFGFAGLTNVNLNGSLMTLNDTSRLVVLGTAVLFIASQAPECTREMRARREMVAAIKEIGGSLSTRQSLLADVMRACPHENYPHRPGHEKCAVGLGSTTLSEFFSIRQSIH